MTIYLATQISPQPFVVVMKGYCKKHGIYAKALKREYGIWPLEEWQILAERFA